MPNSISKDLYLFFFLLFLSFLLLILDHFSRLSWLRAGADKLSNPVKGEVNQLARVLKRRPVSADQNPVFLQAKIDYLEAQKALLEVRGKSLEEENAALKKQAGVTSPLGQKYLAAKNLGIHDGLMTIDKGEKDGVGKGMIVLSEGILVGRISATSPFSSRVSLPTKENNKIPVKILPSSEKGNLLGKAQSRLLLEDVLQKVKLENDQLIVTSGESGVYPPDLPIGKIEEIIKNDVEIYQKAEVRPLVDYQNLKIVMIRI